MNVSYYIAKRYLFSKKTNNAINIISGISVVGVSIGTFALVVVLSAFNGLQDLVNDLYSSFDPDIKITAAKGKTFSTTSFPKEKILAIDGIQFYTESLEETVLLKHRDKQNIAVIKGVQDGFIKMSGLDTLMAEGELKLKEEGRNMAVVGYGIAYHLSLNVESNYLPITVYAPKRTKRNSLNPEEAFNQKSIAPSGVFTINPDFDEKYVLVPLPFAREVLGYEEDVSSIELGLVDGADDMAIKEKIQQVLGKDYKVRTQFELNELIFKTNNIEKWITFLILSFILLVAIFNILGSLTMLILDKKKDITILKSMGASLSTIENIFIMEGMLIVFLGMAIGMVLGAVTCWVQQVFEIIKLSGIIIDHYPVSMQPMDFILIFGTVASLGFIASWIPVKLLLRRYRQTASASQ